MTLIVGMKEESGKVWIGSDTLGSNGSHCYTRLDPKIFVKSGYIIGFTSSYRFGQIIQHHVKFSENKKPKTDKHYKHIVGIIEAIRKKVTEYGYAKVDNNQVFGGRLLIGWKHNLFMMDSDFQYSESALNYSAVGSGYELALGSLYTTENTGMETKDRLLMALRSGSKFDPGVQEPFIIKNTNGFTELIET